ncbi:MAG: hypothetical protein KKA56_15665, partial [Gammaproteobacteria bacterium]|nr:hypothetical protein [Gammaproteobacteria bacterium]
MKNNVIREYVFSTPLWFSQRNTNQKHLHIILGKFDQTEPLYTSNMKNIAFTIKAKKGTLGAL